MIFKHQEKFSKNLQQYVFIDSSEPVLQSTLLPHRDYIKIVTIEDIMRLGYPTDSNGLEYNFWGILEPGDIL